MIHAFIKKGCFQDSVSLMIISRKLSESENVDDVSVMMGTPANKALLDTTGFWHDDFNNATPNDICVAIRSEAADAGIAQAVMQQLEKALKQLAQGSGSSQALTQVRRWDSASQKLPDANLADAPRDKCTLSCAINGIHAAFHYLKKNYISGCVMTVPTG
ncbi:ABC transporter substrate-binding protein [Escherichia coli]|nr:ABC transporter substrate-binding protein [Escherichia coli]